MLADRNGNSSNGPEAEALDGGHSVVSIHVQPYNTLHIPQFRGHDSVSQDIRRVQQWTRVKDEVGDSTAIRMRGSAPTTGLLELQPKTGSDKR
jgi:hypothetical protein